MATTPQEFKYLALELKEEFAGFFVPREFKTIGTVDPRTGTSTGGVNESIECFRDEYDKQQIDGKQIQAKDFKLLVIDDDVPEGFDMRTDNLKVTVDSALCQVVMADIDGANALWTLQVRG